MNAEEPQSGYFFMAVFFLVLAVIVVGIYLYLKHVHSY